MVFLHVDNLYSQGSLFVGVARSEQFVPRFAPIECVHDHDLWVFNCQPRLARDTTLAYDQVFRIFVIELFLLCCC